MAVEALPLSSAIGGADWAEHSRQSRERVVLSQKKRSGESSATTENTRENSHSCRNAIRQLMIS